MISITFYQDSQGNYKKLDTRGHAGYAPEGQDIVCAAVSVLVLNAINSIAELTSAGYTVEQKQETGEIHFQLLDTEDASQLLMDSLVLGLESIQESYDPDLIQLFFKEV